MDSQIPEVKRSGGQSVAPSKSLREALTDRLTHGDIGSLTVIFSLVVIGIVFQVLNSNFLTPLNLTNLMVQIASVGTIAVGIVLILLIGEIDLSVGAVSGLSAAIMAVLNVKMGVPAFLAILVGMLAGATIGLIQGWWFARLHVPSFVVTLAGWLGWQGALLYVLGSTGTINLNDPLITGISNYLLPVAVGWVIGVIFVGVYAYNVIRERFYRLRSGLPQPPLGLTVLQIVGMGIVTLGAVGIMSIDRNPNPKVVIQGIPAAVLFFIGFIILFDLITRRTTFGRHLFAVGGNVEAARRAGINVEAIRIAAFVLGALLAACGGILAASRLFAVNQSSGAGDVLLNSIAAAVIGGTSLFGGRGSTWSALLGALVIGAIANGMNLMAFESSIRFMVTGAVLLLAVTLDAYTRSRREVSGR